MAKRRSRSTFLEKLAEMPPRQMEKRLRDAGYSRATASAMVDIFLGTVETLRAGSMADARERGREVE